MISETHGFIVYRILQSLQGFDFHS